MKRISKKVAERIVGKIEGGYGWILYRGVFWSVRTETIGEAKIYRLTRTVIETHNGIDYSVKKWFIMGFGWETRYWSYYSELFSHAFNPYD